MEVKTFFLLKVRTKSRSRWIEHLIKSQIGVNAAVVDFDKRLLQVSYNQDLISVQYMRMLVRSLGCDLLCNDKDIKDKVNQLNNYLILKKRVLSISFVFFLSFFGLIFPYRDWITLLFSSIMYLLYSFLFVPLFNKKVIRRIKLLDAIGIAVTLLLIFNAVLGMFVFFDQFHLAWFLVSILLIEIFTFLRWKIEKDVAVNDLL
jgi:Cu2+-exporting ATPase